MIDYREVMAWIGTAIDDLGVIVMLVGVVAATGRYVLLRQGLLTRSYTIYRQSLGRAILLGLEFLIAGDIIRTVVVAPTLENVYSLGLIVLIRTFLSMALQLEVEGHWPWQSGSGTPPTS